MQEHVNKSATVTKTRIPAIEGLFHVPDNPNDQPYLIGTKCPHCGNIAFPGIPACHRCGKRDAMQEYHFGQKGKIASYTVVRATLPGFESPSIQSLIALEEGITIWALLTGCDPFGADLDLGMDVELVIAKVREDAQANEIVSYQYQPIRKFRSGE